MIYFCAFILPNRASGNYRGNPTTLMCFDLLVNDDANC